MRALNKAERIYAFDSLESLSIAALMYAVMAEEGKLGREVGIQDKTTQDKTRQDKTRQDKTRLD